MPYALTWLPDVLLRAGLKVAEVPGWENRGRGAVGPTHGVLCHHTAGPKSGNMPSLTTLIEGRRDLRGPLAQLGLGRDGTYYVIAAGTANHAGVGLWKGVSTGNFNFIGIEAENTGLPDDDPWPAIQLTAYQRGVAAILAHVGVGAERCAGHKEYALPRGRKTDPSLDMSEFRSAVEQFMSGAQPIALIPRVEPVDGSGAPGRPTLRRGAVGDAVRDMQRALGATDSGSFDAALEARVREFQRQSRLVPDGIIGPQSWAKLDARVKRPELDVAQTALRG
jgi:peptidoglycan hydrolase-like protein with peptidoglycan-binding domain